MKIKVINLVKPIAKGTVTVLNAMLHIEAN